MTDKKMNQKIRGLSTRVVLKAFKMAIVNVPEKSLTEEQADEMLEIIVEKVLSFEEENTAPKFHNFNLVNPRVFQSQRVEFEDINIQIR